MSIARNWNLVLVALLAGLASGCSRTPEQKDPNYATTAGTAPGEVIGPVGFGLQPQTPI
jgi:hypothetical protein